MSLCHADEGRAVDGRRPDDLGTIYGRYFDILRADTPSRLDQSFRLRYEVYCVEHRFLDPAANPCGRETDGFDSHSVHSLLIHRASGATCGTVRLILPAPAHPLNSFPVFGLSSAATAVLRRLPPLHTAEISRFAVSKAFRRRVGEAWHADVGDGGAPPSDIPDRRVIPHITFGLMRAVLLMSLDHGITHLCAVMEPALLRLVARFGLHFEPAGELVAYHGPRQPCFASVEALVAGVREAREDMWAAGTDGGRLCPAPCPPAAGGPGHDDWFKDRDGVADPRPIPTDASAGQAPQ